MLHFYPPACWITRCHLLSHFPPSSLMDRGYVLERWAHNWLCEAAPLELMWQHRHASLSDPVRAWAEWHAQVESYTFNDPEDGGYELPPVRARN